ncbi:hypothetical protein TZ53_23665 (plasmid) [Sphingobium sp. YBL2]|nr:hypothetical protein TZ53_23665 [Sphingobium sp. YBL2]
MSAAVISGVDTAPVFDAAEHIFDAMPLAIEDAVVGYGGLAVALRWDAGRDASCSESVTEPVGVVSAICEHGSGRRQGIDQQGGALVIAGLSFGQNQADGPPAAVADRMEFGRQSAATASDTAG